MIIAAWIALVACGASPSARAAEEAFDREILEILRARDPGAVPAFEVANAANHQGKYEEANAAYLEVERRAPWYFHATRRRCAVQAELGHWADALALCRKALESERSPENLTAMARVLSSPGSKELLDLDEARTLVLEAIRKQPDRVYSRAVDCHIALLAGDLAGLRNSLAQLRQLAPDDVTTHYYAIWVALNDGSIGDARAHLERAKAAGLQPQAAAQAETFIAAQAPWYLRYWKPAAVVVAIWAALLGLLVVAGLLLSRLTLNAVTERPQEASGRAVGLGASTRSLYRAVITIACGFYYVSLPLVLLTVVVIGGGLIYGFFAVGHIPIKLVAIIGILVVGTVWSVLRSLVVVSRDSDPGEPLDLNGNPELAKVLNEIAAAVNTAPVDKVFVTPGTDLAVYERGRGWSRLARRERCLILGVGLLEGMPLRSFRSVLAHEYGHFSNADTAGGSLALAVRRSMITMAQRLGGRGAATWYNPAWLFLRSFYSVFLRISQGASRLQEVLADRWAAFRYGSDVFAEGLRFVIERSVRFEQVTSAALNEVVKASRQVSNLYQYTATAVPAEGDIETLVKTEMERAPSPYDSHPAPAQRLQLVAALAAPARSAPGDDHPVWELFADRKGLERLMTDVIRRNIEAQHGVTFPRENEG
jgi:Zn-dependent protease with chaperone function